MTSPAHSKGSTRKRKSVRPAPSAVSSDLATRAHLILKYAHDSAAASLKAFDSVRKPGAGTTTDEEQDLLRAMLVFSAAGLDSMLKQAIKDTLPLIAANDPAAHAELEQFALRRLRSDPSQSGSTDADRFLARLLSAKSVQDELIEEYSNHLVRGSLQSPQELIRAVKALGLDPNSVGIDPSHLKPIFDIRNQIIHELDINFNHPKRNRQTRARDPMLKHADTLLQVAEQILRSLDAKCTEIDTMSRGPADIEPDSTGTKA